MIGQIPEILRERGMSPAAAPAPPGWVPAGADEVAEPALPTWWWWAMAAGGLLLLAVVLGERRR